MRVLESFTWILATELTVFRDRSFSCLATVALSSKKRVISDITRFTFLLALDSREMSGKEEDREGEGEGEGEGSSVEEKGTEKDSASAQVLVITAIVFSICFHFFSTARAFCAAPFIERFLSTRSRSIEIIVRHVDRMAVRRSASKEEEAENISITLAIALF